MGTYLKKDYPLHGCKGECILSLLIEFALNIKSVYFEVHNSDDEWNLYWNYELLPDEFIPVMQQNAKKGATFTEALKDENVIRELSKLSKTYSCKLDIGDITTIKDFIKEGLSEVNRRRPHGYDGHMYKIQFHNIEKEYRCWCVIPKEWENLNPIIELCVKKANLSDRYLASGIA